MDNTTYIINRIYNDQCLTPIRPNTTVISNVYEGIPETILFNVISWVVLILLFAILRNRAWDYGRLALVHTEKWTQLFYKNTDDALVASEELQSDTGGTGGGGGGGGNITSSLSGGGGGGIDVSLIADHGCLWFPSIFKITKDRIYNRCGPDASHYLSFQQHLLILSACITVCAVCVILPVNFHGNLQGNKTTFGHTTLSNLEPTSKWLWIHIVAALLFVPLTILIMRRCSGRIPISTKLTSQTLMITHISHSHRNADDIRNYLSVRYPDIEIRDVQVAYRVKKLIQLDKKRQLAHEAKSYCILQHNLSPSLKVQPYGCIVCCPWRTRDARQYYTDEEERLIDLVIQERNRALQRPLGIAFVTLPSEDLVQYVINTFQPGTVRHWLVTKAPTPSDLNWENLEISYRNWYSKAIIINFLLFLLFFFLTTPIIIVNILNNFTFSQHTSTGTNLKKLSPFLADFLPTLILLSLSALMPVLVGYSDEWMSHWTKSKQNQTTMHKTFFFLLFMVLILPSLGLTSAQAFVEWSLQTQNMTLRWDCIFLADKGAFFVNYVITSALIGTALELLRFPELAMYVFRLLRMKSQAEMTSIRKEILSEFPFGIHYAWTLLIFTISTVYSLICPLITPFGLIYLVLKHFVDKYNIYYVYKPMTMSSEEGQRIHGDAVRMVRISVLLLQLIMTAFSFLRGGFNVMSIMSTLGTLITGCFFFFLSPFPTCKPIQHSGTNIDSPSHFTKLNEQYIAPVLLNSEQIFHSNTVGNMNITTTPQFNYGSSSNYQNNENPIEYLNINTT